MMKMKRAFGISWMMFAFIISNFCRSMAISEAFVGSFPNTSSGIAKDAKLRLLERQKSFQQFPRNRLDHSRIVLVGGESLRGGGDRRRTAGDPTAKAAAATSEPNNNDNNKNLLRELLGEVIGTFLIVQIGTGSVMSAIFTDSLVGLFQIASVWIIAVTIAISTTASISGAHLNPAVSVCSLTASNGRKNIILSDFFLSYCSCCI
jgi:hypothetical protein